MYNDGDGDVHVHVCVHVYTLHVHTYPCVLFYSILQRENTEWREGVFSRVAHGLIAVLLALKKRPFIRYVLCVCDWSS